jgi:hypothetical protein
MTSLRSLAGPALATLIFAGSLGAAQPAISGTYQSRPDRVSSDGAYHEVVNRFKP